MAVDALRFSPYPRRLSRRVDILSIGRRRAEIHRASANLAKERDLFYVHDTFAGSYSVVEDYRQHREMLASMMKRSRFFVVAPAKTGTQEGSRGQVEVGLRYYEGAAAGAVMIGQAPVCDAYRTLFNWQDAVVEVDPDGSDFAEVLTQLASDPDWMDEISRRNAAGALLQHDWVHRWERIIEIAGLNPTPALLARKARLVELARIASGDRAPTRRASAASGVVARPPGAARADSSS
jgi:glycosyltransferase involved in cell wall biosynthesis